MNKLYPFLFTLVIPVLVCAQSPQKMSYQSVVRDEANSLVINRPIGARMSIVQGSENGNTVYSELFNPNPETNANGLLTLEIGGGIPVSGTFALIDWSNGPYFIKTEIDPSGGINYTVTGISQLLSVPFAMYAASGGEPGPAGPQGDPGPQGPQGESGSIFWVDGDNSVSTAVDVGIGTTNPMAQLHLSGTGAGEGNVLFEGLIKDEHVNPPASGPGTRLMWFPDKAAFRAGTVTGDQWDIVNIGYYSNAWGENTIASGSTATAWGNGASATGTRSTAWGWNTSASGGGATAWGVETTAPSWLETVFGGYNTLYTPEGALLWNPDDRLFVIGNGTSSENRHNALTILKNGNTGIGTDTPSALLHTNGTGRGEGNVVFVGSFKSSDPGNPPVSGAGTRMMWYPDKAAFRAGEVTYTWWDIDSIGDHSTAWGYNTLAKGIRATAWGNGTTASGQMATAWGQFTNASSPRSTAWGIFTNASNYQSTAWGIYTTASGASSTAWGNGTTASVVGATAWGNGTTASGESATAWGESTIASGEKSTVWGTSNTASGNYSTAWGSGNTTTESYSSVWGQNNQTKGILSTAWGVENEASGGQSTAWGSGTHAAGGRSTAWGYETLAHSANETALGHFSTSYIASSQVNIVGTDRLFVIGNGTSNTNRNNALTVLKNGKMAIGSDSPVTTLHVSHGTLGQNVPPTEGLRLHNSGVNNNSWTLYTVNSNGNLQLYANNALRGTFSAANGVYTSSSNRRLKTDITVLNENILERVLQLQPVSYRFISHPQSIPTIGFIAEDALPLFPELIETTGENGENLGVNYAAFSVIAIKAIQLQQQNIADLENTLVHQQKQVENLQAENEQLKKRLEQVESFIVSTIVKNE